MNIFPVSNPIAWPDRQDEFVQFFPTYSSRNLQDDGWRVHIHGWVYRPKEESLKRAAVLGMLRRAARLDRATIDAINLKGRLRPFLFDNKRRRRLKIALGDAVFPMPATAANGHFRATLEISDSEVGDALSANQQVIPFSLLISESDERLPAGTISVIGTEGLTVISDIDDTIKVSDVTNRRALFANTFLRDFRAATGMASAYRKWAATGAAIHYVSASPWQLFVPLADWLAADRFPTGSIHLRNFRLKDRSLAKFLGDTDTAKRTVCEQLLGEFPRRRFVLVGDSGERDPEMYAGLAREFPEQIERIFVRNVSGESRESERMHAAFAGLDERLWRLFDADVGIVEGD